MSDRPTSHEPTGDSRELLDPPETESSGGSSSRPAKPVKNGERKRPHAFGRRLAIAFSSVAALTALLAALLLSMAWSYQFNQYVQDNLQRAADGIATLVQVYYPSYGFGYGTISRLPILGVTNNVGVQLLDAKGNVIYDEASMRRHIQDEFDQGTATVPKVQKPNIVLQPKGQVVTSPIKVNGKVVGEVRVWAYGATALMTDRDTQFRRGSFAGLAIAALVAIALASIAGVWYSTRLVRPIQRITATAQALQDGDRNARTGLEPDDEIGFLGRTFDNMADSIEADREMERRLTADVAHELRTPLQAIQATVEAMQDGVLPADEERLGIVRDETRRLSRLTDGILELTRLERGAVNFAMARIDASGPVRAAVDALEPLLETCELRVTTTITEGLMVEADRDRLQQAVSNLLSNAARYTEPGGTVEVTLRRDSGCALIEVSDTGVGIDEEDVDRVFSRFWRADNARATATGGLGIGLAVTKEIVERHDGTIWARRRSDVDHGTTFAIRIPLA